MSKITDEASLLALNKEQSPKKNTPELHPYKKLITMLLW